jgi:sodium/proline symporter
MFGAIVIVPACVVAAAGGFSETVNQLNAVNPYLQNLFTSASTKEAMGLIGLTSCLAWGLGYFGMPHILVRFMSIDNPAEVKGSRRIAMAWVFISLAAAVVIGLVGHLFLQQHTDIKLDDPEKIFMVMINTIFANSILAKIFAGILLSSIMAAIMSTADSQLLVSASAFTNDLYKKVLHKNASNRELVLVSRIAVAAIALAAVIMASNEKSEIFKVVMKMVSFAWGGFGAAFGPLILLALFWKRTNLAGAVAGMVVGAATCFIWKFYLTPTFGNAYQIFNLYELAPGFILSLITIIVVSLCTKAPSKEIQDEFDSIGE